MTPYSGLLFFYLLALLLLPAVVLGLLPVAAAAENPQTDAISMVPSTPRFKMPALCV